MTQVYNKLIFLFSFLLFSCSHSSSGRSIVEVPSLKIDSVEKKNIYEKIERFINEYDVKEDERLRLENSKQNYSIDDSLCFYMAKLDKKELIEDECFRFLMGKLLEKKYLGVRNYGTFDPESFPVYNVSILTYYRLSNSFACNILVKENMNIDSSFVKYGSQLQGEFYCIDSVILKINKLPQMQNDSIHQICMDLVKKNKTGGCMW